jgi:hypothetical protein
MSTASARSLFLNDLKAACRPRFRLWASALCPGYVDPTSSMSGAAWFWKRWPIFLMVVLTMPAALQWMR